ncbi:MAG: tRNA-dihydrouridine synthase family protein [Chlamydiae bacterium]|nr:tRNA-dihydrouridine synthase family protein [Chlamydiota bacterium]
MYLKTSPLLFLAPMEGLGAIEFRKMLALIGGFDECCTEFIRIPSHPHIPSLVNKYDPKATWPIPQAAQLMGVNAKDLAEAAYQLGLKGAPRVELNCGCPSNTVTGKGAGSSLLDTPDTLFEILTQMCQKCPVPVTAKIRIGVNDDLNFQKNIRLVEEAGCQMLTLHARTKSDGYLHPARWEYIQEAKKQLRIPVCGNGDITTEDKALEMLEKTGCDHLMIGRRAASDPFIFRKIRCKLEKRDFVEDTLLLFKALDLFFTEIFQRTSPIGSIKQLGSFLLSSRVEIRQDFLTKPYNSSHDAKQHLIECLEKLFSLQHI